MTGILPLVARLSVPTFIVSSMLAMGLSLSPRVVLAPLRSVRLVGVALFVNFLVSPGVAYLLVRLFPLERPYALGLLLLSLAAGAPFLPKLAQAAGADVAVTAALLVLLTAGTIVVMPFAVPALVPGAQVSPWSVARPLVTFMAVPLVGAMAAAPYLGRFASPFRNVLRVVVNVSLLVVLALFIGLNLNALRGVVGSGAGAVSGLFAALVFTAGYMLGGTEPGQRSAAGLAAAARNLAAALPVASSQSDPKVIVMLLVGTIAGLVVLLIPITVLRRRVKTAATATEPATGDQMPPLEVVAIPVGEPGGDGIRSPRR